jgi:hypothetical protein
MSFSRSTPAKLHADALAEAMRGVGFRLGPPSSRVPADLELTLVSAAAQALPRDYRVLGVVVAWLEVHGPRVNVPRLLRFADELCEERLERAWWAAVGAWMGRSDARWRTLTRLHEGDPLDLDDAEITTMQIRRGGEDERFAGSALRVYAKLLRSRVDDVDPPALLASRHPLYMRRLQLGANYRADVWAALDERPEATPAEIARAVGCAYATALAVVQDWRLVREAEGTRAA